MAKCQYQTVEGFNDYLTEQRGDKPSCLFTLTKFEGGTLLTPYEDLDINFAPPMTQNMFVPGGMTNLFDAIGTRVLNIQEKIQHWDITPNVLFVVMTDGGDNISRSYDALRIRGLVTSLTEQGWTFVYLGADQDALRIGSNLGFQEGNIHSFARENIRETMNTLAAATTVYRAEGSTKEFFK